MAGCMHLILVVALVHAGDVTKPNLILMCAGAGDVGVTHLDVTMTHVVLVRTSTGYILIVTTGPVCE